MHLEICLLPHFDISFNDDKFRENSFVKFRIKRELGKHGKLKFINIMTLINSDHCKQSESKFNIQYKISSPMSTKK